MRVFVMEKGSWVLREHKFFWPSDERILVSNDFVFQDETEGEEEKSFYLVLARNEVYRDLFFFVRGGLNKEEGEDEEVAIQITDSPQVPSNKNFEKIKNLLYKEAGELCICRHSEMIWVENFFGEILFASDFPPQIAEDFQPPNMEECDTFHCRGIESGEEAESEIIDYFFENRDDGFENNIC